MRKDKNLSMIKNSKEENLTQEQRDDDEPPTSDIEPRFWFRLIGGQDRYREWGYVVFRTTYDSQEKWERVVSILRRQIISQWDGSIQKGGEEVDRRLLKRWIPKFRLVVMNDETKYKDISPEGVQQYFREWALQDFHSIIKRPTDEKDASETYDSSSGPHDRDERYDNDPFPGQSEEIREQNRKISLSNKGALHQVCLIVDSELIDPILEAEEAGSAGGVRMVDVYAPGEGIQFGHTMVDIKVLGSSWAWITHHGSLRWLVLLVSYPPRTNMPKD